MSDLNREQFEEWFEESGFKKFKETAWSAWEASRERIVIDLPIPVDFPDGTGDYHQMIDPDDLIDAIHAVGAKTK